MRKSTPPPLPPRPPRPGGPSTTPGRTASRVPTGKRKPNPVVKVAPKKPLTKSTVKNPNAPKGTGSGTSVKVITKSETFMKKAKAASAKTGSLPIYKTVTDSMKTAGKKSYANTPSDRRAKADQLVKNTPDRYGASFSELRARDAMMRAAAGGKSKSKGVTPPQKKTPPTPPKPKTKSRFSGRPGLRGFGGGGGIFGSNKNK